MFQDEDGEMKLIKLVYKNPIIYDRRRSDYKNVTKKTEAWNYVATQMGETVNEVQRAWRLLRERFARERRNLKLLQNSGVMESKWPLFESLLFLDRHVKGRRTSRKFNIQSPIEPSKSPLYLSIKNSENPDIVDDVDLGDFVKVEPNEDYYDSGPDRANTPSSSSSELIQTEPLKSSQASEPPVKRFKEDGDLKIEECLRRIETYCRKVPEVPDYFGLYVGQKLRSMSPTTRSRKEKEIVILLNSC